MDILSYFAEHFDLPVLEWIAGNLYCGFLDAVMPVITLLGDAGIFWIAAAVVMLFFPKYRKIGLGRIRPYDYQLEHFGKQIQLLIATPHDFSFPSGHTLASFEAATAILIRNKKLGIPAMILACLIAFSRMYLYVHYPTDVLFSVALGIGFAYLGTFLVDKVYPRFVKNPN